MIWFVVQILFRAIRHYQITALEIMTLAFVFCSVFIYGLTWNQPQDIEYPVIIERRNAAQTGDGATAKQDSAKSNQAGEEANHVPNTYPVRKLHSEPETYVAGWAFKIAPLVLFCLFACGFGAIHCLAWNSPFPTAKERLAWRICSATTTALPALFTPILTFEGIFIHEGLGGRIPVLCGQTLAFVYVIGRITLFVLAFTSLRVLPVDAFQTVNWNSYIPHFAA